LICIRYKDDQTGDMVCVKCGRVCAERQLNEGAEWRNFENDDEDHSRVGMAERLGDLPMQLTTRVTEIKGNSGPKQRFTVDRDADAEFLDKGLRDIRRTLACLREGSVDVRSEVLASHYFHAAYQYMLLQKQNLAPAFASCPNAKAVKVKRVPPKSSSDPGQQVAVVREKLARRKTFAVAAIHQALSMQGIHQTRWSREHISQLMDGMEVSSDMLKKAAIDLKQAWHHVYPQEANEQRARFEEAAAASSPVTNSIKSSTKIDKKDVVMEDATAPSQPPLLLLPIKSERHDSYHSYPSSATSTPSTPSNAESLVKMEKDDLDMDPSNFDFADAQLPEFYLSNMSHL